MPSAAELRAELKALRKESAEHKPISRLKKGDVSAQIEALKRARNETPAAAAVPSARPRGMMSSVESIKKAKAGEFPVKPAAAKATAPKARMSKTQMRALLDEMTSDEEE